MVHSDGSEDDSDTPRQPPAKKTKKEKTEERGRKEAASVGFKIEAPRGGSHRICNYEANPRYCTFANSWSTPCREHSTCLYLCTVLLLRLVHET